MFGFDFAEDTPTVETTVKETVEPIAPAIEEPIGKVDINPIEKLGISSIEDSAIDTPIENAIEADASHILELIGGEPIEDEATHIASSVRDGDLLSREEWCAMTVATANMLGALGNLQTLQELSMSDPLTEQGLGAYYDTIYAMPKMHFMLRPGGEWGMRIFTLVCFTKSLGGAVYGEIMAKKAAKLGMVEDVEEEKEAETPIEEPPIEPASTKIDELALATMGR